MIPEPVILGVREYVGQAPEEKIKEDSRSQNPTLS